MEYENQYLNSQTSKYDCLLFDLDDTLYPLSSGIAAECRKNIEDFMIQMLGIEEDKVSEICTLLYKAYGTTMAGLRAIGYEFDYDDFHSFAHGRLPYEKLKTDPVLRGLLLNLPYRKIVFTNGDRIHAAKVLSRLGLEDCFEGIICFETLNPNQNNDFKCADSRLNIAITKPYDIIKHFSQAKDASELPKTPIVCKPSEASIEEALKIANINPQRTMFFDDSVRNIQSGKRVGLHTVLVGTSQRVQGADYALESIHNIREALPELWEAGEKSEKVTYSGKLALETSVEA
ncbi:hypothetical protein AQUCO_00300100v1 [Aquilegia coerulea]|uniref:Uncharacterized protein n=2 Tax=Aquilegia coerulea TaxID=218851 RepID=A0A2G5EXC4_AQUCA|nr:hypothetical protein AQUCO_00300100v1 [Aquilegia coerulea]PIA60370.1 hypothetical protein AQUCO_00300100v1 [Aquilegia coerulea]PIA60372.1 hypothetical protein AQUCO_00300100v1 [Aquilegia coerulea]